MNRRVFQNIFICVASLVLVAALGVIPACAKDSGSKTFDHVYVIVLENHGFDDALYNGPSPFLRGLSRAQGLATYYFGVTHPSLLKYLAMVAGDEFGIRDDNPSCFASDLRLLRHCHRLGGDSLVDQLEAAGLTWALYAESLPPQPLCNRPIRPVVPMRCMRKSTIHSSISSRSRKIRRGSTSSDRSILWHRSFPARRPTSRSSCRTNAMTAMAWKCATTRAN
jgi:hypothetical protein